MICEWLKLAVHAVLCVVTVIGVLFSKTRISQGAVLALLFFVFIGIRLLKKPATETEVCNNIPDFTDIAMATLVKDSGNLTKYDFVQVAVGSLLIVHLIKIYMLSIYPMEILF